MRLLFISLILGLVFVGSVLNQGSFSWWEALVARYDRWTFLPYWAFFAPNPGYAGIHLIYRDRASEGYSAWQELVLPESGRWRWLWHPERFQHKALHDLFNGLHRTLLRFKNPSALELTTSNLALLSWAMAQPALKPQPITRQFSLIETTGFGEARRLRPLFISREYAHAR